MANERMEERLANLELEVRRNSLSRELLLSFAFLVGAHVVAIFFFSTPYPREGNGYSWLAVGGIGTLAVWFTCAARPWTQRLARVTIAIAVVASICLPRLANLRFPHQREPYFGWSSYPPLGVVELPTPPATTPHVLLFWLAGATAASIAVNWFFGLLLIPPDIHVERKPVSLSSFFVLMVFAAIGSQFIRGLDWWNRFTFFTTGISPGLVASAVAYGVFSNRSWTLRIGVPVTTMTTLVVFDFVAGALTNTWRGDDFGRLAYVVIFVTANSVSPLLSFAYLKTVGYRMQVKQDRALLPET